MIPRQLLLRLLQRRLLFWLLFWLLLVLLLMLLPPDVLPPPGGSPPLERLALREQAAAPERLIGWSSSMRWSKLLAGALERRGDACATERFACGGGGVTRGPWRGYDAHGGGWRDAHARVQASHVGRSHAKQTSCSPEALALSHQIDIQRGVGVGVGGGDSDRTSSAALE